MRMHLPLSHVHYGFSDAIKTANRVLFRRVTSHNFQAAASSGGRSVLSDETDDSKSGSLDFLALLQEHETLPTDQFLNKFVSCCAKSASIYAGIQVHTSIVKIGFTSNVYICSALIDMYAKCGIISSAQQIFDEMPNRNAVTWNCLISGHLDAYFPEKAIELFLSMMKLGVFPTAFTVSSVLVVSLQFEDGDLGIQIHCVSVKLGSCYNVAVGTCLIDMYSRGGNVEYSKRVFDEMTNRNVIVWTSMVNGYAHNKQPDDAMILVIEMKRLGLRSNHVTYNSLLSSFSTNDYLDHCKQVHCLIVREGLESNVYLAVTLVTVYSECGCSLVDFHKIGLNIKRWDQVSWNAVIAGFSNLGDCEEAIKCFSRMRQTGSSLDIFTHTSILKAAGVISALDEGRQFHTLVFRTGYASHLHVQNGLVSMYARCGAIDDSKKVFLYMKDHDLISWNSLLSGFAHHGYGREAIEIFERMIKTRTRPDRTTYLCVISSCSHVGLLEKGLEYFDLMKNDYLIEPPKVEHYASMVDLFGRAGHLHEAEDFIENMPIEPGASVYKALLSACQVHGDMEIAIRTAKKLLHLCPNDPATYVLLSNVLSIGGFWDGVAGVRKLMIDRGVNKNPGYSWI